MFNHKMCKYNIVLQNGEIYSRDLDAFVGCKVVQIFRMEYLFCRLP